MPSTVDEWNERHRRDASLRPQEPAEALLQLAPLVPVSGQALDLASGRGRNALFLARLGYSVTAVDWSEAALQILEHDAREAQVRVHRATGENPASGRRPSEILTILADLRTFALPMELYSLVVCIRYLDRTILSAIEGSLKPGGMVIFETYTTTHLKSASGPRTTAYLLEPGELRHYFPGLEIVFYRELHAQQGIATLLARKSKPPGELGTPPGHTR